MPTPNPPHCPTRSRFAASAVLVLLACETPLPTGTPSSGEPALEAPLQRVTGVALPSVPVPSAAQVASSTDIPIPSEPVLADSTTPLPRLDPIGVTVSGVPIFGPSATAATERYGDPVYNGTLDACHGETGPDGDYRYHALAEECLGGDPTSDGPSPLLGYALDGFPIYGPRACVDAACTSVVELQSGWVQTGDPSQYAWDAYVFQPGDGGLDRCNGRIGPDGTYRYHTTAGFPYVLGCFAGVIGAPEEPEHGMAGGCPGMALPPPRPCNAEGDCSGRCPPEAAGCACRAAPSGDVCLPTCHSDTDCFAGLACDRDGFCVPFATATP